MATIRDLHRERWPTVLGVGLLLALLETPNALPQQPPKRGFPYRELDGQVEEFSFSRQWRSYYWREDFTMLVRDEAGKLHRVISREPTPWNDFRLGTTYPGLAVDWTARPRVRIIGVQAIDRQPPEFDGLKLDPDKTVTAFVVRVQSNDAKLVWRDFFINNWFHDWGPEADRKVLAHYATNDANYTVYGFLKGIAAPFDKEGQKLLEKYEPDYGGILYHGRVVKANNEIGYEVHLLHLLGRHKKTMQYEVFHGDAKELIHLDGNAPPEARKK
jgi:hypothetical protein